MGATRKSTSTTRTFRMWPAGVISSICLLIAISVGIWYTPVLLTDIASHLLHSTKHAHVFAADSTNPVPLKYQLATEATAQQYMTAFLDHHYSMMWSLLHPQIQAVWPGESAFTTYWQNRFKDYALQSFVLGNVHWLPHWVNPETMITYNQVLALPVSLQLVPNQALQQHPLASPEDAHPNQIFQNLPFIVERVASPEKGATVRWLVLSGGPVDLETPILPPLQPTFTTVQVPILMYHHISDVVPKTTLGTSLTVTPTAFGKQLDYLKQQGYHTITFNQLFDALYYGGPLPHHPIILTFDDGYNDAYQFALPILQAHAMLQRHVLHYHGESWLGRLPELEADSHHARRGHADRLTHSPPRRYGQPAHVFHSAGSARATGIAGRPAKSPWHSHPTILLPLRRAIPQWHPLGPTANRILASSRPLRRRHNRSRHIWHHPA